MTILIPQMSNTITWYGLFNTVNLLANIVSNSALTIGSNTVGDSGVTGNFFANIFSSNTVVSNNVYGSNVFAYALETVNLLFVGNTSVNTTINSSSISISSNSSSYLNISTPSPVQISNGQFFLNANGNFTTVPSVLYPLTNSVVITNTAFTQTIDSWSSTSYNLANYNICVIDNVANNFYSSKINVINNSNNVFITEYAQITSNSFIGTFSATSNSTIVSLNFTPSSNSTTVKFFRELI